MKSVRRACALLAVVALLILAGAAGARFSGGHAIQDRARGQSVTRPAPSTMESWERERTAFVQRMKKPARPVALDEARRKMAECFTAEDFLGAEKVLAQTGLPPWQHLVLASDYSAGCGDFETAAGRMTMALDGQRDIPEHNGEFYVQNLISAGDLWLKVREQAQRDGDSAGAKEVLYEAEESYRRALQHSRNLPGGRDHELWTTARDRLVRTAEAHLLTPVERRTTATSE